MTQSLAPSEESLKSPIPPVVANEEQPDAISLQQTISLICVFGGSRKYLSMWFEAVPSLAIIGVCMTMPQILIYFTNKIGFGNAYRRFVVTDEDKHNFLRDARLSGINSPYKQIGLSDFKVDKDN